MKQIWSLYIPKSKLNYLLVLQYQPHHASLAHILSSAARGRVDAFQGGGKARRRRLERQDSNQGKALLLDRAMAELFMQDEIRAIKDERNHLIQSSKPLLRLQILTQIVFFPLFEPFLAPIVEFPQEMCPYLVIKDSLNGILCIPDWKTNDNSADCFNIVMDYTCGGDGVFCELEIEKFADFQSFYILLEIFSGFFQSQGISLSNKRSKVDLSSFFKYLKCQAKVLSIWTVVFHIFLVLLIHNIRDIRVDKEGILLEFTFKEEHFLLFQVKWFEFFEAGGEIGFFLSLDGLFILFRLCLFLWLTCIFLLLFFFDPLAYFFLDDAEFFWLFEVRLACDDWRGSADTGF